MYPDVPDPVWLEAMRIGYAERLIQGTNHNMRLESTILEHLGDDYTVLKWIAIGKVKEEEDKGGDSSGVRGVLAYLLSHTGSYDKEKKKELKKRIDNGQVKLEELSYEELAGTKLEWTYIFKLLGKEINFTREKKLINQQYSELKNKYDQYKRKYGSQPGLIAAIL